MVSISGIFIKKSDLKDGNYVVFVEDEGILRLIPLISTEQLQEESITVEEMIEIIKESRTTELELEK